MRTAVSQSWSYSVLSLAHSRCSVNGGEYSGVSRRRLEEEKRKRYRKSGRKV